MKLRDEQPKFEDGVLLCPLCGFRSTHLDVVLISAREREDGPINEITVTGSGRVTTHNVFAGPRVDDTDHGRRHQVALAGDCEGCGQVFAIIFKQHKGDTHVDVVTGHHKPWSVGLGSLDTELPEDE